MGPKHSSRRSSDTLERPAAGWRARVRHWLGAPDELVGDPDYPLILRWFLFPKNGWFGIYLHRIVRSDDDRALHDHPKANLSILLTGGYYEWVFHRRSPLPHRWEDWGFDFDQAGRPIVRLTRRRGSILLRSAAQAHRIELIDGRPCWSLFITGPKVREWGFFCKRGWIPWFEFHDRGGCE